MFFIKYTSSKISSIYFFILEYKYEYWPPEFEYEYWPPEFEYEYWPLEYEYFAHLCVKFMQLDQKTS